MTCTSGTTGQSQSSQKQWAAVSRSQASGCLRDPGAQLKALKEARVRNSGFCGQYVWPPFHCGRSVPSRGRKDKCLWGSCLAADRVSPVRGCHVLCGHAEPGGDSLEILKNQNVSLGSGASRCGKLRRDDENPHQPLPGRACHLSPADSCPDPMEERPEETRRTGWVPETSILVSPKALTGHLGNRTRVRGVLSSRKRKGPILRSSSALMPREGSRTLFYD